ncbi:DNA-binding transcriptional LysR family regulator [Evansella vedderi]|uniref:DNA-binding transcriptional LysR family regulator n=1 Tax=Evansella vedderi TaxID=38282 RepID=A0ABT9ZN19_9BACI|nr:selenium metabolism-associated LysR family transcriptional regulator [Evansella vedderi]MDQ0252632.1 DNA-binding transcriptional LysR family regulator [Evansella vedderi]
MDLKKIKTFMMVVDHKSFSTVAELLDITQPGVSKQIKNLEKTLGVPLVYRDSLEPTEAGRIVYRKGTEFISSWEELVEECRQFQGELSGQLRVGASSIPGTYFVPAILRNYLDNFPRMEIQLSIFESEEVVQQVLEGKLDIGYVGSQVSDSRLASQTVAKDKLLVIGPAGSEEAGSFHELKEHPFIFRSSRSGTWKAVIEGFRLWGHSVDELKCVSTVHNTEGAISMVEAGLGYTVVSDIAAKKAMKHGNISIVAELPVERTFYAICLANKEHNKAISPLMHGEGYLGWGFNT